MKGLQLPLGVQLSDRASLDTFVRGPNGEAIEALRTLSLPGSPGFMFVYGARGSGKSHLLQALTASAAGRSAAAYLPLRQFMDGPTDVVEGLDGLDLVCLDDLDAIGPKHDWMVATLRLLDQLRSRGARCAVSANAAPERLLLGLADLRTRLSAASVYGLKPLSDDDRQRLLLDRATERGLQLAPDAVRLLLSKLPRDNGSLLDALDRLDRDSLGAKRRLTLPFIADWLRQNPGHLKE